MGRRSYEIMGRDWAASEGPIATAMNGKPKAVFSHTLKNAKWGPAEIFGGDLSAEIADLKARDDRGTILVHGGPDFATSLTRLALRLKTTGGDRVFRLQSGPALPHVIATRKAVVASAPSS